MNSDFTEVPKIVESTFRLLNSSLVKRAPGTQVQFPPDHLVSGDHIATDVDLPHPRQGALRDLQLQIDVGSGAGTNGSILDANIQIAQGVVPRFHLEDGGIDAGLFPSTAKPEVQQGFDLGGIHHRFFTFSDLDTHITQLVANAFEHIERHDGFAVVGASCH